MDPAYGALGTWTADDTAAIQAAYTAAGAVHGEVYFPWPLVTYKISAPISIPNNVTTTMGNPAFPGYYPNRQAITLAQNSGAAAMFAGSAWLANTGINQGIVFANMSLDGQCGRVGTVVSYVGSTLTVTPANIVADMVYDAGGNPSIQVATTSGIEAWTVTAHDSTAGTFTATGTGTPIAGGTVSSTGNLAQTTFSGASGSSSLIVASTAGFPAAGWITLAPTPGSGIYPLEQTWYYSSKTATAFNGLQACDPNLNGSSLIAAGTATWQPFGIIITGANNSIRRNTFMQSGPVTLSQSYANGTSTGSSNCVQNDVLDNRVYGLPQQGGGAGTLFSPVPGQHGILPSAG